MGAFSIWHILIIGAAGLLLFGGRGKISDLMGDFGKGIKSFRTGLTEPDPEAIPSGSRENSVNIVDRRDLRTVVEAPKETVSTL